MGGDGFRKLAVWCRPLTTQELRTGVAADVIYDAERIVLHSSKTPRNATFNVETKYQSSTLPEDIYEDSCAAALDAELDALGDFVFLAYGASDSGKDDLLGCSRDPSGLMQQFLRGALDRARAAQAEGAAWTVDLHLFEVHDEDVFDLLRYTGEPLRLVESKSEGWVYFDDTVPVPVQSADDFDRYLEIAKRHARGGARSHMVHEFILTRAADPAEGRDEVIRSVIFVNLAGSERSQGSATGQRGLHVLSDTLRHEADAAIAAATGGSTPRSRSYAFTYKDSKLTRYIRTFLSGNVALVGCIVPGDGYSENVKTLTYVDGLRRYFGDRAAAAGQAAGEPLRQPSPRRATNTTPHTPRTPRARGGGGSKGSVRSAATPRSARSARSNPGTTPRGRAPGSARSSGRDGDAGSAEDRSRIPPRVGGAGGGGGTGGGGGGTSGSTMTSGRTKEAREDAYHRAPTLVAAFKRYLSFTTRAVDSATTLQAEFSAHLGRVDDVLSAYSGPDRSPARTGSGGEANIAANVSGIDQQQQGEQQGEQQQQQQQQQQQLQQGQRSPAAVEQPPTYSLGPRANVPTMFSTTSSPQGSPRGSEVQPPATYGGRPSASVYTAPSVAPGSPTLSAGPGMYTLGARSTGAVSPVLDMNRARVSHTSSPLPGGVEYLDCGDCSPPPPPQAGGPPIRRYASATYSTASPVRQVYSIPVGGSDTQAPYYYAAPRQQTFYQPAPTYYHYGYDTGYDMYY